MRVTQKLILQAGERMVNQSCACVASREGEGEREREKAKASPGKVGQTGEQGEGEINFWLL